MQAVATQLRRISELDPLPDGQYDGRWGGYHVTFVVDGIEYEAQTNIGIRTPNAPCVVTVSGGKMTVEPA